MRSPSSAGTSAFGLLRIADSTPALRAAHELEQLGLERPHPVDRQVVEVALRAGEHDDDLLLDGHRAVQRLLEQLDQAVAALELGLGDRVELGAERGERLELAELGEVELQRADTLFIALICAAPPTRDTEMPTSTAGRTPDLNRLSCRYT